MSNPLKWPRRKQVNTTRVTVLFLICEKSVIVTVKCPPGWVLCTVQIGELVESRENKTFISSTCYATTIWSHKEVEPHTNPLKTCYTVLQIWNHLILRWRNAPTTSCTWEIGKKHEICYKYAVMEMFWENGWSLWNEQRAPKSSSVYKSGFGLDS
jgi:hypothetical protein